MELENFYKGDEDWRNRVTVDSKLWTNSVSQIELLEKLDNHLDIAIVVNGKLGDSSLSWIDGEIPALENLKPVDCLQSESFMKRLKVCLSRMHQ
ncbi:MAG: hypothetical protein R2753_05720 [Chitinophagales bacterium]